MSFRPQWKIWANEEGLNCAAFPILFQGYRIEGVNILCETDGAGAVLRSWAYDPSGHPVAYSSSTHPGETFFLHQNPHGDVIYVTRSDGAWVKKYSYDPWGKVLGEQSRPGYESLSCPHTYAGYYYDSETGLYALRARYYSPLLRRFLTRDPHPGRKTNPLTLNPYQYCGGNPVIRVDPSGQFFSVNIPVSWIFPGMTSSEIAEVMVSCWVYAALHNGGSRRSGKASAQNGPANLRPVVPLPPPFMKQYLEHLGYYANSSKPKTNHSPESSFLWWRCEGGWETARTWTEHASAIGIDILARALPPAAALNVPNMLSEIDHLNDLYNNHQISGAERTIRQIGAMASVIPGFGLPVDIADAAWDFFKSIFR